MTQPSLDEISMDANSLRLKNEQDFSILVIKNNKLDDLDWKHMDYINKIMEKDFVKFQKLNPKKYMEEVTKYLNLKEEGYHNIQVNSFCEQREYIYEILYNNLTEELLQKNEYNELATLLAVNGEKVYGDAIVLKTCVPENNSNMYYENLTEDDIKTIFYDRVNTNVVTYSDDTYINQNVKGSIDEFAKDFFEGEYYKTLEIPFLSHNINIMYLPFEYGEENVCGKLIEGKIEKCIWFSMINDQYSLNLYKDEVEKIIHLSNVLKKYEIDDEIIKEEFDDLNRKILKTRNRVLNLMYNKYK